MTEHLPLDGEFDAEWRLADVIASKAGERLVMAFEKLLGARLRVTDESGRRLAGAEQALPQRAPVRGQLEPVGYVEVDGLPERAAALAHVLEHFLRAEGRYRMASRLHLETIRGDYEALQEKHAALQQSEERYRTLAAQLDLRVKAQVKTIETAQRRLYQSEKMAAVGQLAAGVAHEINTPIGFIRSNLNTARRYRDQLAAHIAKGAGADREIDYVLGDMEQLLRESMEGTERVERIVTALKDFSQVDREAMAPTDVNALLRSVGEVLKSKMRDGITLEMVLEPVPLVRCHAGNLGQVFYNLIVNAMQAIAGKGSVRVTSAKRENDIVVTIRDTGCGIPAEVLPRVFEPFFTTKEVGQGTGLGLTVSHDIVRAHGGRIDIASKVGVGTEVSVLLPVAQDASNQGRQASAGENG